MADGFTDFSFTDEQIAELELLLAQTPPPGSAPAGDQIPYAIVYAKVFEFISTPDLSDPLDDVPRGVWLFIDAAADVNADGNDVAIAAREYSFIQTEIRDSVSLQAS